MRECLICGAHKHVQSCEKIQLCTRCAGVLWDVLYPKLHPEKVNPAEDHSVKEQSAGEKQTAASA